MTYSRKYDFQAGTRISSSQVDDEFNQLIAAVNTLESGNNSTKALAQMKKVTTDSGRAMLTITDKKKDLLAELAALGIGLFSFNAVDDVKNLPPSGKGSRGLFHQTGDGYGWAFAIDTQSNFYTIFLNNGVWQGWRGGQSELWSGALYVQGGQTITPSKTLSKCKNGWILVWSDYDPSPDNKSNDYDVVYSFIPKGSDFVDGYQNLFIVPNYQTSTSASYIVKKVRVYDNKLEGFDENNSNTTGSNDVVLRQVLEW